MDMDVDTQNRSTELMTKSCVPTTTWCGNNNFRTSDIRRFIVGSGL